MSEKKYYTIKEVAEQMGVNASKLRYYEKEFSDLKPHKTSSNQRLYTQENIDLLQRILYFTNEKKLTLKGVKQQLQVQKKITSRNDIILRLEKIKNTLTEIRDWE